MRYRHTDSTYSRDARQQTFLSELKRQTKDLGNLTNVTNFRKIFGENIEISIRDPQKFLSLLELALVTPKDRIARVSINAGSDMTDGRRVDPGREPGGDRRGRRRLEGARVRVRAQGRPPSRSTRRRST